LDILRSKHVPVVVFFVRHCTVSLPMEPGLSPGIATPCGHRGISLMTLVDNVG
jgi:hypothetical protein